MKTFDLCKEYCIGCGLCKSELHADMKKNAKGFWFPNLQNNEKTERFLEHVCPIADNCLNEQNIDIWDFTLTEEEMAVIAKKDLGHSEIVHHDDPGFVKDLNGMRV